MIQCSINLWSEGLWWKICASFTAIFVVVDSWHWHFGIVSRTVSILRKETWFCVTEPWVRVSGRKDVRKGINVILRWPAHNNNSVDFVTLPWKIAEKGPFVIMLYKYQWRYGGETKIGKGEAFGKNTQYIIQLMIRLHWIYDFDDNLLLATKVGLLNVTWKVNCQMGTGFINWYLFLRMVFNKRVYESQRKGSFIGH